MDVTVLRSLRTLDDDGSALRSILTTFLDDLPRRLHETAEGIANGDVDRVRRAVHALKGSASLVGAPALSHAASVIEEQCKKGNAPSEVLLVRLRHHAEQARRELQRWARP